MTTFGDQLFQFGGEAVCSGSNYPGDYGYSTGHNAEGNRVYYVNNITGSDTANDGLSWRYPFAQVSKAITASEAHRATLTTNNQYVRNRIYVQGTKTAYTLITALPLYCDIIGVGADPRGTNDGVPRIGSDTVAESGCVCSATVRGLNVYNMQFQAGAACYCLRVANMFRSRFENCTFMTNGAATAQPAAGIYSTTALGSVIFKDCFIGTSCSRDTEPLIGMKIEGTTFHNCLVENCIIPGKTAGVTVQSTVQSAYGSIFKNNFIGETGWPCVIGVDDNSVNGDIVYAGNYFFADTCLDLETKAHRACGNMEKAAFVAGS